MTGLVIRRATTGDAALLARFGADEFTAAFGERNDPDDLRAYLASAFSTRIQAAELADADRATWFAETPAADPAGYAMLKRNSQNLLIPEVAPAEVQRFYVSQPFHGRGLAHELMSVCIEQARAWDSDVIWLGVWEVNERAIAFYEKCGFRKIGHQYFLVGADRQRDYVMARTL